MPALAQEVQQAETKEDLKQLRVKTSNKFYFVSPAIKSQVLYHIRRFRLTRDLNLMDFLADKIQELLHLEKSPFDYAWNRDFKAFFGYEYCLKYSWGFLVNLADD